MGEEEVEEEAGHYFTVNIIIIKQFAPSIIYESRYNMTMNDNDVGKNLLLLLSTFFNFSFSSFAQR